MAKTPKLTATAPNGQTFTRETARDYRFVIAIEPRSVEVEIAALRKAADEARAELARFEAALAKGDYKLRDRRLGSPFWLKDGEKSYSSHEAFLVGAPHSGVMHASHDGEAKVWGDYDAEGNYTSRDDWHVLPVREALEGQIRGAMRRERETIEASEARAAGLADGSIAPETDWKVARWTTRADLAEKALGSSEIRYWTSRGYRAHIVPVD